MINFFKILKILFPKGLAFFLFKDLQWTQFITALGKAPERIALFFENVRDSGIPGRIPADSVDDWDKFLALDKNNALTTVERNERIVAKYSAQGGQGPDYIEGIMQDAGYPVFVTENSPIIDPGSKTGLLIPGPPIYESRRLYSATQGGFNLGNFNLGAYIGSETLEVPYVIPSDPLTWIFFFFLTGSTGIDDFVNISIDKKNDFIKQILQIKPAHVWVIAQVNFI